jgi:molybdopterin-containing oxidoreductase family membrane subunit
MEKLSTKNPAFKPIIKTGKDFYGFIAVTVALLVWSIYSWTIQLTNGLSVTGLGDIPGGAPYGIYIANFIFFVGISHAGIAISSVVRLMSLERYKSIARMAELVTVVSLPMAILSIIIDLGRPDRFLNTIIYGRLQSPVLWDIAAITIYFVSSLLYLVLSMKSDMSESAKVLPKRKGLYKFLSFGYKNTEASRQKQENILRWMAIAIIPIMVSVHTVVSWVFGLMASRPGWYTALFGIYFVVGAIASGLAIIVTIAWLFRKIYSWEEYIPDEIFKGLGWALRLVLLLYLYLWISDIVTVMYAGPEPEVLVLEALLYGKFSLYFWSTLIGGLLIPAAILFMPMFNPNFFSVGSTAIASILINIFMFLKRVIIVVPSLTIPRLYPIGHYTPTFTEISVLLGTFWIAIIIYALFVKLFPIIELDITRKEIK